MVQSKIDLIDFNLFVFLMLLFYKVQAVYECRAGTWGAQCGKICGHCVGGGEFCQVYDGLCMNGCASGYKGDKCKDECSQGTFGPYCKETCGNCAGSGQCDTRTGHCLSGCIPGFQLPFCKTPCAFMTYGKDCTETCGQCPEDCGCDPVTGDCRMTCNPATIIKYRKASTSRECINQYALKEVIDEYAPPDVLEIPWREMLSVVGVLGMFVLGNFVWWWFMVRTPSAPREEVFIDRSEMPEYLANSQDEKNQSIVLAREKKRMAAEAARAEANKRARGLFGISFPSTSKEKVEKRSFSPQI